MCEETHNYLWATQDILGHGATSQVYKAYNKSTGELVAAKVYQVSSNQRAPHGGHQNYAREKDFRPILDREMDILKAADHENIVRYIALEPVISSDSTHASGSREALLIEYCNGGSLHNVLELPENRYGLMEDDFMLVFKHLTNALKYLHDKNTIHRDIKPDNIMLSININGERTYKLADLGVARLINEGENAFTSLVGTEEYIHPDLYRAAVRDNKTNVLRTALQTRVDFPFEVDLWSLGVTLYQCATGELPFQPFAGTRKDRTVMKRILDSKPTGCISGVENTPGGEIQWSKTLPASCRLSPNLKHRLETLLQRLLESERSKLMTFREFFTETDRILNLIPIYYLNLKLFKLSCGYFEPSQSITKLYDELQQQNGDENNEDYYCLFQNVPYPISKSKPMSIRTFCEQLPIPTSRETPLVFYTFSPIKNGDSHSPKVHIPDVKPIRQYNDVAAACEWSKDIVGLFFYVKTQLIEYQHILQTAQCSTTIMQQHLKSKLLEFLCSIRSKLIVFRAIEELKNILDQIDNNTSGQVTPTSGLSLNYNGTNVSGGRGHSANSGETPAIGFSHLLNNPASADSSLSPVSGRRQSSTSPMQLIQQSIRIYLRSYLQPYEQLKKCEQDILQMIEKEFGGQLGMIDDKQPYVNTLWLSHRTKTYSSWIHRIDKQLKDLNDLHESFRKDRLLSTYNRLQSDSHFRRRKNLEQLHDKYVRFATDECYPNLVQIFHDYNEWIKQRSNMIRDFERIQQSYDKQCEDIMNYVEMIDNLRTVVYKNIRELTGTPTFPIPDDHYPPAISAPVRHERTSSNDPITTNNNRPYHIHQQTTQPGGEDDDTGDNPNKTFINKIRGTTKKTIQHAEEGLNKLDGVIKQLRTNIQKK
ncbi:unnamed protein product [Adineta ricciae]|uniref:Protein kinase domain-containing protein n=1 Tax=Adineta ricciae TaxID=249248 RepID=A0A813PGG2_ADIRI|nr:unnamed protein product [Adineta ricciae]CAF0929302.1 unnamed protein product [Adineta ricciae]